MAPHVDPYRTLGLTRDASLAEVKKAYRRLAKIHHPDAAGETALPRFLAIQAAYDQIVGPGAGGAPAGRPGGGSTTPRRPWDADPDRADATRRAYGGRARRNRAAGGRSQAGTGTRGSRAGDPAGSPPGDAPPAGASPDGRTPGGSPGGGSQPPGGDGPARPPNKATLGSTSYDGAEAEPFEPDWGGASWYGTTSGTYWTLNPKEYADPRKHGPEYQARARRAAARSDAPVGAMDASMGSGSAAPAGSASPPPTHTTSSWWQATAGPQPATSDEPGTERAEADDATRGPTKPEDPRTGDDHAHASTDTDGDSSSSGWAWLEGSEPRLGVRVGRAILGWLPIGLGVGWLGAELTGCGRFAADCDTSASAMVWLVQVGLLVLLLLIPALAALAGTAAITVILVTIPTVLVLSAPGTGTPDETGMTLLLGVLLVAWVVGLGAGVVRAARRRPLPVS